MERGSPKDVVRWFKPPWLRASVAVAVLSYGLWLVVCWALVPVFGESDGLSSPDDTPLTLAEQRFGPVLLVQWPLTAPPGAVGDDKWVVLRQWGFFEMHARLLLVISVLWLVVCVTWLFPRLMRAFQPKAAGVSSSTGTYTKSSP